LPSKSSAWIKTPLRRLLLNERRHLPALHPRFFADILLTPLEATRIRLVSDRKYATGLLTGFARLSREEGLAGLYAGFIPILLKQIPYAIGQFTVNEWCHELATRSMTDEQKANLRGMKKFGIDLGSGIIAGFAAAVLSHVRVSNPAHLQLRR
jgi:solute carrier family 25 (mitochondrial phosphate transporter), member 3